MDALDVQYRGVKEVLFQRFPDADVAQLDKAYSFAKLHHEGQFRKSGESFFVHPIAVAHILADLGMEEQTLTAALLHDVVEDTEVTSDEILQEFGEVVELLVDGVTKLTNLEYGQSANAETIRKMIVAMSRDIRVLIIKLADRMHNARTWKYVSKQSAELKAKETLEIYAPLAHRLGLNKVKSELEDLSFHTLYPKVYTEIEFLIKEYAPERNQYVNEVIGQVNHILEDTRIEATVAGRPKHLYSVYQKMIVKGKDFKDIYDLVGIRIITNTILDCYAVLGAIHAKWNHLPGRFKDYVAMPKYNMYQSIHTTVLGPNGKVIEIQIRTKEMHQFAQYGIAAHWRYKSNTSGKSKRGRFKGKETSSQISFEEQRQNEENLKWIKQLVDWQKETEDSDEFLDSLRFDLNSDEVFVFSPKGTVFSLPKGATPVDFAYAVHTEVGHKTMGSRINGKLVPLNTILNNSDTVEILTTNAQNAGPSRDWLNFTRSQRARNKIRAWFSKSRREEDIERGRQELSKEVKGKNLPLKRMLTHQIMLEVADEMHQKSIDDLYGMIGRHEVQATTVLKHILHYQSEDLSNEILDEKVLGAKDVHDSLITSTTQDDQVRNLGISVSGVEGENDVWVKLARCCTPAPGDEITGYVTKGQGISVHRKDCFNVHKLQEKFGTERFVPANWIQGVASTFLANIQVEGLDRAHLLADVTRVLSDNHVNILSGHIETTKDRVAYSKWVFEIGDIAHLATIISSIRKIDGVFDVYRLTGRKYEM